MWVSTSQQRLSETLFILRRNQRDTITNVCVERLGYHWAYFHEIWCLKSFENLSRMFNFYHNLTRIMGTLHENQYTFTVISRSVLLRKRNVSREVVKKIITHILHSITYFENRAVYKITWQNTAQPDRSQMTIWRMRTACWIPKATNTHSQYVILIAFPLQQRVTERVQVRLYFTYIAGLFIIKQ
jgi:hypothetical protein